jgi:hypothetical protein
VKLTAERSLQVNFKSGRTPEVKFSEEAQPWSKVYSGSVAFNWILRSRNRPCSNVGASDCNTEGRAYKILLFIYTFSIDSSTVGF